MEVRSIYVSVVYRPHCGAAQYLCQYCVQNSLRKCAVSMKVCVQNSLWRCAVFVSLSTELTVEVRSICVSPVYRTYCGDAQYLCQCVYRTRRGGVQYLCQSCVQNSLWRCAVSVSVLCTELTVEVRTIYVSAVYRTHCGDAQYLYHSVYRTHCGGAQYLCQSCVQNSS